MFNLSTLLRELQIHLGKDGHPYATIAKCWCGHLGQCVCILIGYATVNLDIYGLHFHA